MVILLLVIFLFRWDLVMVKMLKFIESKRDLIFNNLLGRLFILMCEIFKFGSCKFVLSDG